MVDLEPGGTGTTRATKTFFRFSARAANVGATFILLAIPVAVIHHYAGLLSGRLVVLPLALGLLVFSAAPLAGLAACFTENADRRSAGGLEPQFLYWSKGLQLGTSYALCQLANLFQLLLAMLLLAFALLLLLNACFGVRYPANWPGAAGQNRLPSSLHGILVKDVP